MVGGGVPRGRVILIQKALRKVAKKTSSSMARRHNEHTHAAGDLGREGAEQGGCVVFLLNLWDG